MNKFDLFSKKSIFFAPMEGVTDEPYRIAMLKTFPEWDQFTTDFLRIPTVGKINEKMIKEHLGKKIYENESWRKKNSFQILTTIRALSQTKDAALILESMGIKHLDLNLGCPSRKVNAHLGGAYLLSDHLALSEILKTIRSSFSGLFTVKMRIGYKNDLNFLESLKLIEDHGIDAITLHARTRDQLYKGVADWDYIKKAVDEIKIPIVGNGDVWNINDINSIFKHTQCHSVMMGRGALKTPWLAKIYKEYLSSKILLDNDSLLLKRQHYLKLYFNALLEEYQEIGWAEVAILKKFKAVSRYLFEDYPEAEIIRSGFLRSVSLEEFHHHLFQLK